MRLLLKWLLSLAIGAFFVWLAFREWPVERLVCEGLRLEGAELVCSAEGGGWRMSLPWIAASFAVLVAVHFLRVLRWRPLVEPLAHHDFRTLNSVCAVSFMALFLFPLRLGELARPYLLALHGRVRKSAALGTVAVERVLDGLMMALLLFAILSVLPAGRSTAAYVSLRAGALVALFVFVAALGILVLAHRNQGLAIRVAGRLLRPFSRRLAAGVGGIVERFIDGLRALPSRASLLATVLWTATYWLVNGLTFWFLALAFGLGPWVDLPMAYAMMAAVAVGMMIPNPPGNVGSFWYFLLLPMGLSAAPDQGGAPALAFALTAWLLMLVQYGLFAAWFLVRGGMGIGSMWRIQGQRVVED